MSLSDLSALRAKAALADRPGLAKAKLRRVVSKRHAAERMSRFVADCGGASELAAIIDCNESAVRRAANVGECLPLPWWLEELIEKRPDLARKWLAGVEADIVALHATGSDR